MLVRMQGGKVRAAALAQEAWKRGKIVGHILMDVAAASPSVARGRLLQKVRNMGIDENPVGWTDSFRSDRKTIMSAGRGGPGRDNAPPPPGITDFTGPLRYPHHGDTWRSGATG